MKHDNWIKKMYLMIPEFIKVPALVMHGEFERVLLSTGYTETKSHRLASVFTNNSLEGVYSHGVNRFPRFIKNTVQGIIHPDAEPQLVHRAGCIEQWNGNLGPGPLNAELASERAMALSKESGMGMVALANTNHWMRAGAYGRNAVRKGYIMICWTNTCPNMPAWGGRDPRLGNNPMVIAVPYKDDGIVLDFAMSQFSYGKIESYKDAGKQLPFAGGFNSKGEPTTDPALILESWRVMPAGYWKGSSLSLMLDILASLLSDGKAVHQVRSCDSESGLSQVFLAINPMNLRNSQLFDNTIEGIISDLHDSVPDEKGSRVRYPGENIPSIKDENLKSGIPVKKDIWEYILAL